MSSPSDVPFVTSILHPTDFSEASRAAFAHALAIALVGQTRLALLHSGSQFLSEDEWSKFPSVRKTLEAWGLLEEGSRRSDIYEQLRVSIDKVNFKGSPMDATLKYVDEKDVDLLVLGTERREGLPRWFKQSKAARISRGSQTLSLIVPEGCHGMVSLSDGAVRLKHILVPVDHKPDSTVALEYASRACRLAPTGSVTATILHVGDDMPKVLLPEHARCSYETVQRSGEVVDQIVGVAKEIDADLIVMASDGRNGIQDVLQGSCSERVLRETPAPLLIVPQR